MSQHSVRAPVDHVQDQDQHQGPGVDIQNRGDENHPDAEDQTIPGDAPPKILRQAQLARNEQRQANLEKDREINKLQDQVGRNRTRNERFQEKTPQDSKYAAAGKRCAIMRMIWVLRGIQNLEPDPAYLQELRYDKTRPEMMLQGEQIDILASMAPSLREDFLKLEHFQYKVRHI